MKYIGFASTKGGVAKTTSAIHFAYWLALKDLKTVLIDDDANRSALKWRERSKDNERFEVPFDVAPFGKMAKAIRDAEMVVLDTQASIRDEVIQDLSEDCDVLVIPSKPDIDSAVAAVETANKVVEHGGTYRILLTDCPTGSSKAGQEMAEDLIGDGYHVVNQRIRRGEGIRHASLVGATVAQQTGGYRRPWLDYQKAFKEIYTLL
ncbi:ParA family protein [Leptolyngbyaceae cyanobacterium CCMR0082]|uniref:ParA family protein n=1 Tax=Adonisia turfae CCMR0082 TaxID=2304604 RepID=A0A6M0SAV6_9CYAN|nr:ParA family protein [Adonisia turfae]NEZ65635.1 ParA family protein [Adonisia turfae CCMR0082]